MRAYLDRILNFFEAVANGIDLVGDLKDGIAHRRLVEQIIDGHDGENDRPNVRLNVGPSLKAAILP